MKIMITGATGFVGRHLYKALLPGNELYLLTRESTDASFLAPEHEYVFTGDVDHLSEYMRAEKIDGVVHLATLYVAQHDGSQISGLVQSNVYLGTAVLDAAVRAGVKWFLNTGTIWQNYNSPDYSDEYNPVNLYAATKQAFMTIAKFYTETSGIRFATLKLCDTYGPDDTRRKIINLFDEIASTGRSLDMSPGEQLIDIVHVDVAIDGFCKLIGKLADPSSELKAEYVVTSGRPISLRQLAAEYERAHGVKLNINWGGRPYRPREVMRPYLGNNVQSSLMFGKYVFNSK